MVKVTLNLPTYLDICGQTVRLKPGVNEVDPKAWAAVQDHPITQHYISARAIAVEVPSRGRIRSSKDDDQKTEE
mgnify:CR=1 FL=1